MKTQRRRFSLLLLQDSERLLKDYACYVWCALAHGGRVSSGRLYLCSDSMLLEPHRVAQPIQCIKFSDVISVSRILFPASSSDERIRQAEAAFTAAQISLNDAIRVEVNSVTEMKAGNRNHPYAFRGKDFFVIHLPYSCLVDELRSFKFLAQLPKIESIEKRQEALQNFLNDFEKSSFDTSWLVDHKEMMQHSDAVAVEIVEPLVCTPALLVVTEIRMYIQLVHQVDGTPVRRFELRDLSIVYPRKYRHHEVGLELYFKGKQNVFLACNDSAIRNELIDILKRAQLRFDTEILCHHSLSEIQKQWQRRQISNFDYIMALNREAGRSLANFSAYPVCPWVLADYTSTTLNLQDPTVFRDLSKPIGALNPDRLQSFRKRYQDMPPPKFLYGTHYSTPGYVVFFKLRSHPQLMLRLQNGKFDAPNRLFHSIAETWSSCNNNPTDVKELIPEFYMGDGKFLQNSQALALGKRQNGEFVDDVVLPPWASSPSDFVKRCREALESDYVSDHLHLWIDLIFGYKQIGDEAVRADNVFYYSSYEGAVDFDAIADPVERASMERQISEFGCTPTQLFKAPHPTRKHTSNETVHDSTDVYQPSSAVSSTPNLESNSTLLMAGASQKYAGRWNNALQNMRFEASLALQQRSVTGVAISKDGDSVLTVAKDSSLRVYSFHQQQLLRSHRVGELALSSCSWLNDDIAAIGSWDNHIYLYSHASGQHFSSIRAHDDAVSCLDSCGTRLVSAGWDCIVKIWDADERALFKTPLQQMMDHDSEVRCVSIQGPIVASGSEDGCVIVWDIRQDHAERSIQKLHDDEVSGVCLSEDGRKLVTCSVDGSFCVLDLLTGKIITQEDAGDALCCLRSDGYTIAAARSDGVVDLWSIDSLSRSTLRPTEPMSITSMDIHCNSGCSVLVAGANSVDQGYLQVWSLSAQ